MWIATTAPELPVGPGSTGKVYLFDEFSAQQIQIPDGCTITNQKPSFAAWVRGSRNRVYINGAGTDNLVLSEDKKLRRLNILAPSGPLVETASPTGNQIGFQKIPGGITGEIILYLRFLDINTGRVSPLSGGSAIVSFSNHGVEFEAVPSGPDAADAGVTHVEVWASQDGGLPRFWFRRDIGAPTFSGNETVLGEAELGGQGAIPVCKYNAIYHDRLVMAGDERHPERIYFSSLGAPEEYEGLWIATKNSEPITGIYVIRDLLVVQCDTSHYVVQGFDEDDITINVLEPFIGGSGHHNVVVLDRMSIFLNKAGLYMCNGTSIIPIGQKFNITWAEEQHWVMFDISSGRSGWMMHDSENRVIRYKAPLGSRLSPKTGLQTVNGPGNSIFWVFDYSGLVDGDGGIELMFDTASGDALTEPTCGAMLTNSDGECKLYTGTADGKIALDNVHGLNDLNHPIGYSWQSPHISIASPGDDSDCAAVVKLWLHISNEDAPITWTLFAGNSYDWQSEPVIGYQGGRQDAGSVSGQAQSVGLAKRVYNDRLFLNAEQSAGSSVSVLVSKVPSEPMFSPDGTVHPAYDGAYLREDGAVFPAPMIVIKGWGLTYKSQGEASRGTRPYIVE